jgi:hypothetical protein
MANIFTEIVGGLQWVGKELQKAIDFVPKIVTLTDDVEADAETLLPETVTIFTDAEALGMAVIKDGGQLLGTLQTVGLTIELAVAAKGLDAAQDEAVLAAVQALVKQAIASGTWTDVFAAVQKLVKDWDTFGASSNAAIKKLEADA